jgi:dephospho-CoA kinase
MIVVGLTGSIGVGKSTTVAMIAARGVPVYDADAAVHALYAGPLVPAIESAFPGTTTPAGVDRARLSQQVLADPSAMRRLEAIVHPAVRAAELSFRSRIQSAGTRLAVLDIPLLFETGGDRRVDVVVTVTCRPEIQRARVLARPGMSEEKFEAILAKQIPDRDKRRRAHALIDTSFGIDAARRQVDALLRMLSAMNH